jgi:hypothetical protein
MFDVCNGKGNQFKFATAGAKMNRRGPVEEFAGWNKLAD